MRSIEQINLFGNRENEKLGDLERLEIVIRKIILDDVIDCLEKDRNNGRNDYPVETMLKLIIAMKIFQHRTVESFRRELLRNSQLRKMCGLVDCEDKKHLVPSAGVFSRFIKSLLKYNDMFYEKFVETVNELYEKVDDFGENVAGDGKYLDSYAKRPNKKMTHTDNRTENDAEWSMKQYISKDANGKEVIKKEYHYGFKANIICDTKYELPIAFNVKKANCDEKKEMKELLLELDERKLKPKTIALDRGYDSKEMIETIKKYDITPIVDIRDMWREETTKQYEETDIVYNAKGEVFYVNEKGEHNRMNYKGYDKERDALRYSYRKKIYRIKISEDSRIFVPVARDSKKFERIYKGRTSVERLNGRLDRDYMFEDHTIRGEEKMRTMTTLSLLIMNIFALARIERKENQINSLVKVA